MTNTVRPNVDFSGPSRATAREYAAEAIGQKMDPASKALLRAAADGGEVDAYAFNGALTAAYRSGFTRCGSAHQRRDLQRKIGYLSHIVQAVLENHADGLPAYDSTAARSRKVKSLEAVVDKHQSYIKDLEQAGAAALDEISRTSQALTDLQGEHDALKSTYGIYREESTTKVAALQSEREQIISQILALQSEREVLGASLTYALELLAPEAAQRVLGFKDGVTTALGSTAPSND
jgi:hypothetical protein